jgi:hypothetical protein
VTGWVVISRTRRGLRLRRQTCKPVDAVILDLDEEMLECGANATASRLASRIENPLWALEITKYAAQKLAAPLAAAFALSDAAGASKNDVIAARVRDPGLVLHAASFELAARGHRVANHALRSVIVRAVFLFGAALGFAAWCAALVRFRPRNATVLDSDVITAIYGEFSNRTRHLLPPAYGYWADPAFLIVGRPQASLHDVGRAIDPSQHMPGKRLFRAISWRAAAASLPRAIATLACGFRLVSALPAHLPFREGAAIGFRILQGACEAHWWRKCGPRPKTVLFGLTGLADTTQIEFAMQETGSRTVHCVHGVSLGWNFAAHSDVGLFVCGHDAELARRFPGYGETSYIAAEPPKLVTSGKEWVVLTNHTHPMNTHELSFGLDMDRRALDIVAQAARVLGQSPTDIVWKAHPALATLPARIYEALEGHAASNGFRRWKDSDSFSDIAHYGVVISTTSTAALDAMRLGKVPILLTPRALPEDIVYARLPLVANDCDALCACIGKLANQPTDLLADAWAAVQPGGKLTPNALARVGVPT